MISHTSLLWHREHGRKGVLSKTRLLRFKYFGKQPNNDWQILALVECRKNYRIFVGIGGRKLTWHTRSREAFKWIHQAFVTLETCDSMPPPNVQSLAIRKLIELLRQILRITIEDGRVYLGTFAGTDKLLNILLLNAEEYRIGQDGIAGRFVGQVLVPWRLVLNVESQSHTGLDLYI